MGGKFLLSLFSIFFIVTTGFCQSHGLQFSSHEVVQERRTSLNLTPGGPFCFAGQVEISFDLHFRPAHDIYFGYIMRVITGSNQNIDLVYNQRLRNFNLIIGEAFSGVFQIDSSILFGSWSHCAIRFDPATSEAAFYLNNKYICKGKAKFSEKSCYRVYFGASQSEGFQTVDIPPMNVKDVRISNSGKVQHHFPLSETEGSRVQDLIKDKAGIVKNPVWIKPKHQNWQSVASFKTRGAVSIAFNQAQDIVYVVSKDSLYELSIKQGKLAGVALSKSRDTLPPGNQSLFDQQGNRLYNFYIDQQKVSTYKPREKKWDLEFSPGMLTVYWQANKFLSSFDSSLYIIGGYGQLTYKNTVQRYHFPSKQWQLIQPAGDAFMPRYLAGLGVNATTDTAYILGGYGSNTGEQAINPKHNYDLMAFSLKDHRFHKRYHFKEPLRPFCFANSLVIDQPSNTFYALVYPNDRFNSVLQLIKGSLINPTYTLVGDSIPYTFYDIKSFADLYYSPTSRKLVAVTLFTGKDEITSVNVYTIDFPPNQLMPNLPDKRNAGKTWIYLLAFAAIITAALYLFRNKRTPGSIRTAPHDLPVENNPTSIPVPTPTETVVQPLHEPHPVRAIFLFGQFEVFDKEGLEITSRFTPLIRELFLLILIFTYKDGKGISSEQLYEILWGDKPLKDARNNYSVNILKLKHLLEKVGDSQISKESGKWKLEILNDSINIDFKNFIKLLSGKPPVTRPFILELLTIIGRGGFLPGVHYNWLDDIKSQVAGQVIDVSLNFLQLHHIQQDAELTLRVANATFHFDQLNEEALVFKCRALILLGRHGIAKETYLKFSKEYHENYGQAFEKPFADITQV